MNAFTRPAVHSALSLQNQPELSTGRLVLRVIQRRDAEAVSQGLSDFQVAKMLLRVPQPYDRADAENWLDCGESGVVQGWCFAITLASTPDEFLGVISIEWKPDWEVPGWTLGYWLGRPHWSMGYMSETVNAVCEAFFGRLIGSTLHSSVIADNPASLRIQRKLGFDISGVKDAWCLPRGEMVKLIETELTLGGYIPL
jgi:RimJ/RimL family protein N-acetyltransferase